MFCHIAESAKEKKKGDLDVFTFIYKAIYIDSILRAKEGHFGLMK